MTGLLKPEAFLFSIVLLAFSCKEKYPVLKEEYREPFANMRFYRFERTEYRTFGEIKWKLRGEEAYIYIDQKNQKPAKIILYDFEFEQFFPEKAFASSKKATLDYASQTLQIQERAYYRDEEYEFEGSSFDYAMDHGILQSHGEVKMKKKDMETVCQKGVFYDRNQNLQICRKPKGTYIQTPGEKPAHDNTEKNFYF